MKRLIFVSIVCVLALLFTGRICFAQEKETDDQINQKAAELTKDKSSKSDKIISLYSFVRDEIALVKTQYG